MTRLCQGYEGYDCDVSLEGRHPCAERCYSCAKSHNSIRSRLAARVKAKALPKPRKADFEEIRNRAEMLANGLDIARVAQRRGVSPVSIRMTIKRHFPKANTRAKSASLWLSENAGKFSAPTHAHARCRYYIASKRKECGVLIGGGNYCEDCGPKTHFHGEFHLAEVMDSQIRTDGPESRIL